LSGSVYLCVYSLCMLLINHFSLKTLLWVKYQTRTGTNFRFVWSDVSTITGRYLTLSNSSKIYCMAKQAKTFTTMDSHFVQPHENFSPCNLLITEHVQPTDQKEWLCFIVCNANSPSSALYVYTHIGYSFFSKIRCYFFTATLSFYRNCVFLSWYGAVYRKNLHAVLNIVNCKWSTSLFPLVGHPLKMGTLLLNSQ
jgi:hypothetical protein